MIAALLAFVFLTSHQVGERGLVYEYCNESRMNTAGYSEEHCGILQNTTRVTFLCNARNSLITNVCWTDKK